MIQESPDVLPRLNLQKRAGKARGELERAISAVRDVLADPLLHERPDLEAMLRAMCREAGTLATEQEA